MDVGLETGGETHVPYVKLRRTPLMAFSERCCTDSAMPLEQMVLYCEWLILWYRHVEYSLTESRYASSGTCGRISGNWIEDKF